MNNFYSTQSAARARNDVHVLLSIPGKVLKNNETIRQCTGTIVKKNTFELIKLSVS